MVGVSAVSGPLKSRPLESPGQSQSIAHFGGVDGGQAPVDASDSVAKHRQRLFVSRRAESPWAKGQVARSGVAAAGRADSAEVAD